MFAPKKGKNVASWHRKSSSNLTLLAQGSHALLMLWIPIVPGPTWKLVEPPTEVTPVKGIKSYKSASNLHEIMQVSREWWMHFLCLQVGFSGGSCKIPPMTASVRLPGSHGVKVEHSGVLAVMQPRFQKIDEKNMFKTCSNS